tara:strand:+ start:4683 stop:4946 length:264 start_codon:yes stop_codon:yes gene_type:complete
MVIKQVRFLLRQLILTKNKKIMGNMSYCRFENTVRAMQDCVNAIREGETDDLSSYETVAIEQFLITAEEIVSLENDIENLIKLNYGN